jgi:hypothetical protein
MATIILDKHVIRNNGYVDFYNEEYPDIKITAGSSSTLADTVASGKARIRYRLP